MAHLERSVHTRRRALWAGGRAGECLRMRTRCAGGVGTRRAVHGATGAEWEIWRVLYPLGEQTGRVGALDRLRSGLGGRQGCVRREAPAADSSLPSDWGVDGNIHTHGLALQRWSEMRLELKFS